MISHESQAIEGIDIADRRQRRERTEAKRRARNRAALIPDMEPTPHEPAEWFAEFAYHSILQEIGLTQPDYDWSDELESASHCERAKADYLAARGRDMERVVDYVRSVKIRPGLNHDGAMIGSRRLTWASRIPGLKTWAGQQTLAKLLIERQKAIRGDVSDIMQFAAPLRGASGLDRRVGAAQTSLDLGFSLNATSMQSNTLVGMELLAIIGLELVAITAEPDGAFVYEAAGKRWRFRMEDRNEYYGRWSQSSEC